MLFVPKDHSPQALKGHARGLAEAMAITLPQARLLCTEIRNAMCPIAGYFDMPDDPEAKDAAQVSVKRILAVVDAIDERSRPPRAAPPEQLPKRKEDSRGSARSHVRRKRS